MKDEKKRKPAYDIFSATVKLGHHAAFFDWQRWCYGARLLRDGSIKVLEPSGVNAAYIRDPDNIRSAWQVFEQEEALQYRAFDLDGGTRSIDLLPCDVSAYHVNFLALAKWISKKLSIKDIQKPRACGPSREAHLLYQIAKHKANIYVTYATDARQLSEVLSIIGNNEPALLLTLTDWVDEAISAEELLAGYEVDVYPVQTFIRPMFDTETGDFLDYEYVLDEDFDTIVRDKTKLPPKATYLKRPDSCSWKDLRIFISPSSHTELTYASQDWIFAYYEKDGQRIAKTWGSQVFKLSEFCYGKRCNQYYSMLKRLAANSGKEDTTACDNEEKNRRNGCRKELRERLCQMFGYLPAESPIIQMEDNAEIFHTLFSIAFTNTKTDPLGNANRTTQLLQSMK